MKTLIIILGTLVLYFGSTLALVPPNPSRRPSESSHSSSSSLSSDNGAKKIVDKTPISEIRKNPGPPPIIVDTTGSHYSNDWPKPNEQYDPWGPLKTPPGAKTPPDTVLSPSTQPGSIRLPVTPKKADRTQTESLKRKEPVTPKDKLIGNGQRVPPAPKKAENWKISAVRPIPLTPNQKRIQDAKDASIAAERDRDEAARKLEIQSRLNKLNSDSKPPNLNWIPPKADLRQVFKSGRLGKPAYHIPQQSNGRTPYHPNEQSSGQIQTPPRNHQYSGRPGSPRNDPGFVSYVHSKDPYDRSYVRTDRFKIKGGRNMVATTSVYDAASKPWHSANKLNNLKKNPEFTYAEAGQRSVLHRKVTRKTMVTKDTSKLGKNGQPRTNVKDEFPYAATEVRDSKGRILVGEARYDRTNVAPVPEDESSAEGVLRGGLGAHARAVQQEQNNYNAHYGLKTQPLIYGTAIMNGHLLKYDYGNGKQGTYNLPSPPPSPPPSAPSQPRPPSPPAQGADPSPGPSKPRPARAQSLTPSEIERFQKLALDSEEEFPSLPSAASSQRSSSPEPAGLTKKQGKQAKKEKRDVAGGAGRSPSLQRRGASSGDRAARLSIRRWLRGRVHDAMKKRHVAATI